MMKEINFTCTQCSHVDVCCYVMEMKKLDEQLKQCDANVPYVRLNVNCDKFTSKEQIFKKG